MKDKVQKSNIVELTYHRWNRLQLDEQMRRPLAALR
jgi:hypothetical protein